ncbi:transcriptional regulatory protein AlgP-like [Hermetia illucens]|uniref:transcriptional regulatory protein AlgP-like n=1 Tax=Hermetia illucens TaxID=343691 RepID=UPI0018CC1BA4|nr:transcriptional regulatory protein AlgP-like [Hermetia illucens]
MDSPEPPSSDEENVIAALTNQLTEARKELAWLKHRTRKLEALFGIAPDEEIPSPATHNATISETVATLKKDTTPTHVTMTAIATASTSKKSSAHPDAPTPAEAYMRTTPAPATQPTIPAPKNASPATSPSTQTPRQSTSSRPATKPDNPPATPSQRPATTSTRRQQVATPPARQTLNTEQTTKVSKLPLELGPTLPFHEKLPASL